MAEALTLVIESATAACSTALLHGDHLVDERHEVVGRGHAERLVPMIAELLGGRRPGAILVDCGPGSFTGIRVGLAAAHGLAIGWHTPLAGFSSLGLLAAATGESEAAAALIGGHGELFVQSYGGDQLTALDSMRALTPEAAAAAISVDLVVGPGARILVEARGRGRWDDRLPRAADAALLPDALRALPPRPIYGRPPDAKPQS